MSEKNNGGPAFPAHEDWRIDSGMSLRDYFAAKSAQGIIAGILADGYFLGDGAPEIIATQAYRFADAMIAERAK